MTEFEKMIYEAVKFDEAIKKAYKSTEDEIQKANKDFERAIEIIRLLQTRF